MEAGEHLERTFSLSFPCLRTHVIMLQKQLYFWPTHRFYCSLKSYCFNSHAKGTNLLALKRKKSCFSNNIAKNIYLKMYTVDYGLGIRQIQWLLVTVTIYYQQHQRQCALGYQFLGNMSRRVLLHTLLKKPHLHNTNGVQREKP